MSHNKLLELISDNQKLVSLVKNFSSGYIGVPHMIEATLNMLEDDSPLFNIIPDKNKIALCHMLEEYIVDCYQLYIDDLKLDKLLNYGCIEVYKVEASNGLRYATTNEVAQGIKGLIGENVYPAGENEYKLLCLLEWTFYGVSHFFRQAGYKLDYDDKGKVVTPYYHMILLCKDQLVELFKWVSIDKNVENTLKRIKKMQKSHGYKYASYEKDEISENITIKQLVSTIYKVFPRNSDNKDYRWALAMAIKVNKNNYRLSPMEVSKLRTIYDAYAFDRNKVSHMETNDELKEKCELLLKNRYNTEIKMNRDHFAYTIIETLRKSNYSKCSAKQMAIIDDAYMKMTGAATNKDEKTSPETQVITDTDIDMSLQSISDAIGNGLFDSDDD